jgi:hypothetical protein
MVWTLETATKSTGTTKTSTSSSNVWTLQSATQPTKTTTSKVTVTPAVQKAQTTLSKPTLLQTIGNTFSNIVKGITLSFKAPAVSKPLPASAFQTQPTQQKMILITPNQKKLTPLQLDTIQPTSAQLTPQAKKGTQQRTEALEKKVTNILPTTTEAIKQLLADPASLKANPTKIINDVVNSLKEPIIQEKQKIKDLFTAKTTSQKVGKGLEAVSGGANILFSPLSAFFSAVNDIPVLGTASKLITIAFGAIGEGATKLSDRVVETLPISTQAKKDIKIGVGEIVALAAQLALGKITEIGLKKRVELVKKFGEKDANVIIEKATELAQEKKPIANVSQNAKNFGKITDFLNEGEHTPQEIIGMIMKNNLEKTPEGKALIKAASEAQRTGQNIVVAKTEPPVQGGVSKYLYHGTNEEVLNSISKEGLKPSMKGTLSLSKDEAYAKSFAREGMTPQGKTDAVMLRVNKDLIKDKILPSNSKVPSDQLHEILTKEVIPPESLEIYKNGKWQPLSSVVQGGVKEGGKTTPPLSPTTQKSGGGEVVKPPVEAPKPVPQERVSTNEELAQNYLKKTVNAPKVEQPISEVKTSGVAKQIEAKAVEKGMIDKGYNELAQYDSSTIKAQSQEASKYSIDEMNKIATGENPLPKELKPGTPLSIAEDYAIKNKDYELLRKLAKSPLATQISESASELSLSRMRDTNSPVKIIRDLIKTKEEAIKSKLGTKTIEEATNNIKKSIKKEIKIPDKYDWNNFINSIQC